MEREEGLWGTRRHAAPPTPPEHLAQQTLTHLGSSLLSTRQLRGEQPSVISAAAPQWRQRAPEKWVWCPAQQSGEGRVKANPHSLFGLGRCAVSNRPPVPRGGACGGDREEEGTSAAKPPGPLGRSIWVTAANLSLGSGPSLGWRHRTGTCMRAERDSVPSSLRPRCARDRLAQRPGRRGYARPRVRSGDGDAER